MTVESYFDVSYWALIQDDSVYACIRSFFNDSPDNLLKSKSNILTQVVTVTIASVAFNLIY